MGLLAFTSLRPIRRRIRSIYVPPAAIGPVKPLVSRRASDPRLVGAAFDYALRFYVRRLNPKSQCQPWVAEQFVELVKDYIACDQSMLMIQSRTAMIDGRMQPLWTIDRNPTQTLAELQRILQWAKTHYQEYLRTGSPGVGRTHGGKPVV